MNIVRLILALSILLLSSLWAASLGVSKTDYNIVVRCDYGDVSKAWSESVDTVEISFLHSVHKEVETDVMSVDNRGFWLREVRLPETGAGTPYNLEDLGGSGSVYIDQGVLVFTDLNVYRGRSIVYNLEVWRSVDLKLDGMPVDIADCSVLAIKTP
ncbi:hypothetical protein apy_11830 [Aeropyrum pernix]|uniref:DUF1850 domain-containing protein n=1 Tax=Aeropyrum pernix TaxID=56636 RepID=A0A401HAS9_AERPX|nr:hypothetical protein apy_11830 [Aeropyrum pernix]